jgi:hypothetical protein
MTANVDKLIVTNRAALLAKYGSGVVAIKTAVAALVAADAKRGLVTQLVEIDDAVAMKKLGGVAVSTPTSPRQCKRAIDAAYRAHTPDYLMLLGSTDVIPHQDIKNPVFDPADDDDAIAYGDIPYACEHAYSTKSESFRAPTRVVGRLPDLNGAKDPAYLVDLLRRVAEARSRPAGDYADYLGVSAEVWEDSTTLSLQKLFGGNAHAELSPPSGPHWGTKQVGALCHFFNCHGAPVDSKFYGQRGKAYPVAHDAAWLAGRIAEGTVLSAECCYGAELFDPSVAGGQPGICHTYLAGGAYGVFGSSTIAYGPAVGNGSADLLCQYFLKRVLDGASIGRAALEARQDFVRSAATLDPFDLKTLAQFSLMGDPSIHPVQTTRGYETPQNVSSKALAATPMDKAARKLRRGRLEREGSAIGAAAPHVDSESAKSTPQAMKTLLKSASDGAKLQRFASFEVQAPSAGQGGGRKLGKSARLDAKRTIHMAIEARPTPQAPTKSLVAFVVTEWDGQRVLRKLHSR